jgi:hypothetical protein
MSSDGPIFASPTLLRLNGGGNSSEAAYLLVSLQSPVFQPPDKEPASPQAAEVPTPTDPFSEHRWWESGQGWKNLLNNLRLMLQPYVFHYLLLPWLRLFDIPGLRAGFLELLGSMNVFHACRSPNLKEEG